MACSDDVCENHTKTVHIEKTEQGYWLIRNGKPFYIKGGAAQGEYLVELKNAGANTARIYDTIDLKTTLDEAYCLDLAVVVDIPLPKFNSTPEYYEEEKLFQRLKVDIKNTIISFKDHPALLYWNLGNEIYYPYLHKNTDFFSNYNELIELIHELDGNHPVSTSTIGANKSRVLSIITRSPQLDFVSFNSFGTLSAFSKKLSPISPIWDGPHVITEWGVNGPWEAETTSWMAPIEETSTKKAEQIKERHGKYILPMKREGSLGSFVFYWGQKNENTPSWYSLFSENKLKTQAVFELKNIWNEENKTYPGPELEYILLNEKGAKQNIVLEPLAKATMEVVLTESDNTNYEYTWEIRRESWFENKNSEIYTGSDIITNQNYATFKTPKEEGPYRIFLYLKNGSEYYATANIPFYVLNPDNEEK